MTARKPRADGLGGASAAVISDVDQWLFTEGCSLDEVRKRLLKTHNIKRSLTSLSDYYGVRGIEVAQERLAKQAAEILARGFEITVRLDGAGKLSARIQLLSPEVKR